MLAVAMDNVDFSNWSKSVGHYKDGKWVNLYTGKKNDALFHQNMIDWMKFLKSNLAPVGVKVVANIKSSTAPEEVILKAINEVDF